MAQVMLAELVKKEQLRPNIFKFSLKAGEIADSIKPGQFIEVKVSENTEPFLRRPISIYNTDKENGIIEIIFRASGNGTEILAKREEGEFIDLIGPLGHGSFQYEGYKNIAVLGGGIGVFPLYELAKNAGKTARVNTYLGFKDEEAVILEEKFKNVSDSVIVTTDDGTYGKHGFAIDVLREDIERKSIDGIFACGPLVMLKAVQELAKEKNIPCQISLEEKMGCGFGVCLGCAVKPADRTYFLHVCKEGPVFDASKVEI